MAYHDVLGMEMDGCTAFLEAITADSHAALGRESNIILTEAAESISVSRSS